MSSLLIKVHRCCSFSHWFSVAWSYNYFLPKIIILLQKTNKQTNNPWECRCWKARSSISYDKRGRSHTPHSSGPAQPASPTCPASPTSPTSPASPLGRCEAAAPWQCTEMHFDKILFDDEKTNNRLRFLKPYQNNKKWKMNFWRIITRSDKIKSKRIIVQCGGLEGEEGFDFLHACNYLPLYLK